MGSVQGHGGWMMEADHEVLERLFGEVIAAAKHDNRRAVAIAWRVLERHLLHHLDIEEMLIFPMATLDREGDVEVLRAEHSGIRASLGELGIVIDASSAPCAALEAFAARVREHERREHEWLYRWTDVGLDAPRTASIARRVRAAWKRSRRVAQQPSAWLSHEPTPLQPH